MLKRMTLAPVVPLALLLAAPAQAGIKYSVTELKADPGFHRGAVGDQSFGLNNAGQGVGRERLTGLEGDRAAIWDRQGNVTPLAVPDGTWFSKGDGINNAGVVSGTIAQGTPGDLDAWRAARWVTPGSYEFFLPDNGHHSSADVINDNGWIGGIRYTVPYDDATFQAYVWSPDGTTRWIDPTIDGGRIEWFGTNGSNMFVGQQALIGDDSGTSFGAVVWTESVGVEVLPGRGQLFDDAQAINDAGIIVGGDYDGNVTDTGLWWDADHNLHTLAFVAGTTGSAPNAINNRNQIAGWSADETQCDPFGDLTCRRASLWDLNGNATDLNSLIDPGLGYTLLFANDINDLGEIYGEAIDATGRRFLFLARPVPEPATWAMMVLGFMLSGTAMRRRTRQAIA
jgi:hypothetical protein